MNRHPTSRRAHRQGFVLVAIIVLLALSMALFGLWAQAAVRSHHFLQGESLRLEAGRLAESGVARAIAQRAADPNYATEAWSIPAAELGGKHAGVVGIQVESAGDQLRVKVVAKYPAETVHQSQVTKTIELPDNSSENES